MNRFVWARIVGIVLETVVVWGFFHFGGFKKAPNLITFSAFCVAACLGGLGVLSIVWIIDFIREIGAFIEGKFRKKRSPFFSAIVEVMEDLVAGRDNQMATFNERKRREKLQSFE